MYNEIKSYLTQDIYPFHMPGHKRNQAFLPPNLLELDMTEISGMDILSSPEEGGIIHRLQTDIATFYGASQSFFMVNGSSGGILAAVCAMATNSNIVVPRNAHTSVYNALALSGATPMYILPQITCEGLAGGIAPHALDNIPQGATVLVVSPTYEGFVSDIGEIASVVHKKNGILIVDEAHGAHFPFHPVFPQSAITLGADIVVQSFHKTLPALGQTAVLHVGKNSQIDINRLKFYVNAVQTSSPSYILMSVCDFMLLKLWSEPFWFNDYVTRLEALRAALPLSNVKKGQHAIHDIDIGKILLPVNNGHEIAKIMSQKYKVEVEMAMDNHILAMTSVADTDEGFARLVSAVEGVSPLLCMGLSTPQPVRSLALPDMVLTPKQAINSPTKKIPWQKAAGHISAQLVAKYPPGIAIVAPGERVPLGLPPLQDHILVVAT